MNFLDRLQIDQWSIHRGPIVFYLHYDERESQASELSKIAAQLLQVYNRFLTISRADQKYHVIVNQFFSTVENTLTWERISLFNSFTCSGLLIRRHKICASFLCFTVIDDDLTKPQDRQENQHFDLPDRLAVVVSCCSSCS
jgi:hypothetical protein